MKFIALFALASGYAIVRYMVFGSVPVANLPCFLMNKALSLTSVLALCIAAYHASALRSSEQRQWFACFTATLFLHVALSLFLFSPAYYPKMFSGEKMNLSGELFMLCGVIALFMLMFRSLIREHGMKLEILQPLSLVAIALHNFFLGAGGWMKWREWPGSMPPISMLGFVVTLVALGFQMRTYGREKRAV